MNIIKDHEREIHIACRNAMRMAIEAGIEGLKNGGQAFPALNAVLIYRDTGDISVIRQVSGSMPGDVYAGKAVHITCYVDWALYDFTDYEAANPDEIDIDEYLDKADAELWNTILYRAYQEGGVNND